jgi:hypothetical protein
MCIKNRNKVEIRKLRDRFNKLNDIEEDFTEIDEFQEKVYSLEQDIFDAINQVEPHKNRDLTKLANDISELKNKNDFYNADDELDRLFPNGQDDG